MLYRMFNSIPGCSPPPNCDNQKYLQTLPNIPCGAIRPWLRTTAARRASRLRPHQLSVVVILKVWGQGTEELSSLIGRWPHSGDVLGLWCQPSVRVL